MNLNVADPNIGDALCAFPTIEALRPLRLRMENAEVAELLPRKWRSRLVNELPADEPSITLDIWQAVLKFGRHEHPTQIIMRYAGITPSIAFTPKINVDFDPYAGYDIFPSEMDDFVLLAPWSKDPARGLTPAEANELVSRLAVDRDVIILGARNEPRIDVPGVHHYYGAPLGHVLALMKRAKLVITTDSACNRLAHAANIDTHLLLATRLTPIIWQAHPKAHVIQSDPGNWPADFIMRYAQEMVGPKSLGELVL